ncbi:hypothetical protein BABA_03509 [Neobacillus bataviensis LMG 21833]|uniref:Uncharacterized protein n=1 Tax=Neobacillus bataviensis LMG 21833 TaxID=1117379 RepID=K6DEC6_9BACI|nr:hypothetical protein [Neobacillus bataviensis]EKN70897.1 hypothetical protein BABA_03509 [Neobacillus bataviensis LMG 21833]
MKKGTKYGLYASLIVLIGFPVLFFCLSLFTGKWNYLLVSIPPSLTAGLTCLMVTRNQIKKERKSV